VRNTIPIQYRRGEKRGNLEVCGVSGFHHNFSNLKRRHAYNPCFAQYLTRMFLLPVAIVRRSTREDARYSTPDDSTFPGPICGDGVAPLPRGGQRGYRKDDV
jgi:hypothetical protein